MCAQSSKPRLFRGIFFAVWGSLFLGAGVLHIVQGSFRYGRQDPVIITPDSHPIFFWGWLTFACALGILALWRAVADFRLVLRCRTGRERDSENPKDRNA